LRSGPAPREDVEILVEKVMLCLLANNLAASAVRAGRKAFTRAERKPEGRKLP
jgi:hypothetical protein